MSDTAPTPTTVPGPNYPGGSTSEKVKAIVGSTGDTTATDIQSPGVPKGATSLSGRPPKKVVNSDGTTSYVYYIPNDDANLILTSMRPTQRDQVLQKLYERGQYGGAKRGNGLNTQDVAAFADLLYYSNALGKPWDESFARYLNDFPVRTDLVPGTGRKAPIQVTNSNDIKAVFKRTAQSLLGRDVDEKIADAFVNSIQSQERAQAQQAATQSGGFIEQTPNVEVMAQKAIEDKFAVEQRVQNAANAAGMIDSMIKGLAR